MVTDKGKPKRIVASIHFASCRYQADVPLYADRVHGCTLNCMQLYVLAPCTWGLYTTDTYILCSLSSHRGHWSCSICLESFTDAAWLRSVPICGHTFHDKCLTAWLRRRWDKQHCTSIMSITGKRSACMHACMHHVAVTDTPCCHGCRALFRRPVCLNPNLPPLAPRPNYWGEVIECLMVLPAATYQIAAAI